MASSIDTSVPAATSATSAANSSAPIIVDLGKKKRKQIKQLRQGRGKLMEEVQQTVDELKSAGTISGNAQPVVLIVRPRSARGPLGMEWPWS
jgi:hypothetical protein